MGSTTFLRRNGAHQWDSTARWLDRTYSSDAATVGTALRYIQAITISTRADNVCRYVLCGRPGRVVLLAA